MVRQIADKAEFDRILADNKLVMVDFYATWCGPCRIIAPYINELESKYSDVVFLKVDVDDNVGISDFYGISAMPTFLFFHCGKKVTECKGANQAAILSKLMELLNLK